MRSMICSIGFALTAALSTASGQLTIQDQFLLGGDPAAGQYIAGSPLHGQAPTGGTLTGFHGPWDAPVSPDDYRGTAYADPGSLAYQVGPEHLATDGGKFRWHRTHASGGDKYAWRGVGTGSARDDWWASILVQTTEQSHYGTVLIDFAGGGTLEFGLATHGFPLIAERQPGDPQLITGQAHLLVAHLFIDPVLGQTVELWADPVPLRANLDGSPPTPPLTSGAAGHSIISGPDTITNVNLRMHTYAGYEMFYDELRVGGSWNDVVPVEVEPGCNGADIALPLGVLDLNDIGEFVAAFTSGHPVADLAAPVGVLDLADIAGFIDAFLAGCP